MIKNRYMMKFVYILLGVASMIIPGPIVPIVSLIIVAAILVYKIKRAKEGPDGFEALKVDIIIIAIVLVVDIGIFGMRIFIENEYDKYNYFSKNQQEITASDFAESAILAYRIGNYSQFSDEGNHLNAIKSGFTTYLKEKLEITNITVKDNKITCIVGSDTIVFTVTKNDIKYSIK